MKTSSNMLFILTMMMSTMIIINSSNWISIWVGLEMNMMSFIPLMIKYKNIFTTQSMMMYFLVQSMSSIMFISLILMNKFFFKNHQLIKMMIMTIMMMKMGMPPMHLWFVEIMNKMSWKTCFMIMTWQKIAPMYIMSLILENNKVTFTIICMSTMMGSIMGLNQTSTHKIMAYSSINHMGWMMATMMGFKKSWFMYWLMYSMLLTIVCYMLYMYNIMYINQMNMFSYKTTDKILVMSTMLSLGGIPPFLGFMPKLMTINIMIHSKEMMLMIIMMMSSLITLSYYLKMSSSMNLTSSFSQKWMLMSNLKKKTWNIMLTNTLLPLIILILNFN